MSRGMAIEGNDKPELEMVRKILDLAKQYDYIMMTRG